MTKRKRTKRTVRSWEMRADTPGLQPTVAVEPWDMPLLVDEVLSVSSAARNANDRQTWTPCVIVSVKGRYNRTDQRTELKLILPADDSVESIAHGLVEAMRAARSDAAAESLKESLGWAAGDAPEEPR